MAKRRDVMFKHFWNVDVFVVRRHGQLLRDSSYH